MGIGIKLQRINTEDFIWVIYFFIALFAIISDTYEKKFLINNDKKAQKTYKTINITIFIVALFIYVYFVFINYQDVNELKREASKKEVLNQHLSLISALLFLVGGAIALYVELTGDAPDVELA
ncbi:MAG: hypothetical protein HFI49_03605 [Bacilli bacterium]|jgi:amino acid transporter|nr:hypothetical protein [Bacilli bacterium]